MFNVGLDELDNSEEIRSWLDAVIHLPGESPCLVIYIDLLARPVVQLPGDSPRPSPYILASRVITMPLFISQLAFLPSHVYYPHSTPTSHIFTLLISTPLTYLPSPLYYPPASPFFSGIGAAVGAVGGPMERRCCHRYGTTLPLQ